MKTTAVLNKELINIDLIQVVSEIKIPFYIIIGEYDLFMNSSKNFLDSVKAEKKYFLPSS
jgi:hypothetical protein